MKTKPPLHLLLLSVVLLIIPGLSAEEKAVDHPGEPLQIKSARATDLIGREVRDVDGAGFATLEDFLIDIENGRVVHAVISGSDAGEGRVGVPSQGFDYNRANRMLRWQGERARLGKAPRFSAPGANRPRQAAQAAEVYRYYDEEPYFSVGDETVRPNTNNVHTMDKHTSDPVRVPLGRVMLASDLIGAELRNAEDKKVGAIEDLILDLPAGRVVAVIIGGGGFLGIGASQNAVPPAAISYVSDDTSAMRMTASRDTLRKSPRYKAADAARFDEPGYTDEVYRSFEQEPYTRMVGADNTRTNRRDRDGATLTPVDQGNEKGEVETTARIRKAIIARDGLSVNAQNVKIITRGNVVTLRGPVKTSAEKAIIGEIAAREGGSSLRVDNQIEVAGE